MDLIIQVGKNKKIN